MPGKFSLRRFSDIDINDPFFDSLKSDYQGSVKTAEFTTWFNNKAREERTALVFDDAEGLGAFIAIKPESETIELDELTLPAIQRLKICTFLISPRYRGQRLGEGALGLVLWKWQQSGYKEVYVTVFEAHNDLINQLEKFGFNLIGHRDGECVYIKRRDDINYSDPYTAFPFIDSNYDEAGYLVVDDTFHDTLFPYSELKGKTTPKSILDVSNGLSKTYLGSPTSEIGFKVGDPVFIYRKHTGDGKKSYISCITTYCMVKDIVQVNDQGNYRLSYEDYLSRVGNKSVYSSTELETLYKKRNLVIIELVYYGFFGSGNNVNWRWLKDNNCWPDAYPISVKLSHEQFNKILKAGKVDVNNVIID